MQRLKVLVVVCLLLFTGVGQSSLSHQEDSKSQTGPRLEIAPGDKTIPENRSTTFFFYVSNPTNRSIYVLLYIGSPDANDELKMKVDEQRPDVKFGGKMAHYREYRLKPGEQKLIPILIESNSKPGNHEVNATAVYLARGNHTRKSKSVTLEIKSLPCPLPCQLERQWERVIDWLIEYRSTVLTILGLIVAILSFFGYERMRRTTTEVELIDDESPSRDKEEKQK